MKKFLFLFILALAYLISLFAKFGHITAPLWISSYLADLICLPLMLSFCLLIIRWVKKRPDFYLNGWMIFFVFIYVLLVFELILPLSSPRYTADPTDAIAYACGGFVYFKLQKKVF